MAIIDISINNSEIKGKSKVLGDVSVTGTPDINVRIENSKIEENAELLERLTLLDDTHIDELIKNIESTAVVLEKNGSEYEMIQHMLREFSVSHHSKRGIIKKYIPELLVGTLANVIATYLNGLQL